MLVCADFLNVIFSKRKLNVKFYGHILIKADFRNQSVGRNNRTVGGGQILCGKQSEADVCITILAVNIEAFIVLHDFFKAYFSSLIFIDKAYIYRISYLDFLSRIGKLDKL